MTHIMYEWDLEDSKVYMVTEIEKGNSPIYGETFILTLHGFGKIYAPEEMISDINKNNKVPSYIIPIQFITPGFSITQLRYCCDWEKCKTILKRLGKSKTISIDF